ncbi:VOC family protein [Cellulomonas sp. KRMCY2]|uniref:VOC family protein n=1 Tax=Cellulomonas sp. KRMCY2 TaxID=1304865 RepID=UPI00045EC34B|nr:VOC family protein [Cellulomonas sp. KRMCY2]
MGGRVVHFELPFDDGERAQAFYATAFGWAVTAMPEMDYLLVMTGPTPEQGPPTEPGFINGGMMPRRDSLSGSPVVVVDVEDIDATLATVESLGGSTVQGKAAVADMGFTAYVKDTEGNVVGLWQNALG